MQEIIMYATAETTLGVVRDFINARKVAAPVFTRGFPVTLKLRLFADDQSNSAYPISILTNVASWQCVFDVDYNSSTTPPIVADNANIYVQSVSTTINGTAYTFTEVVIPIVSMDTTQLSTLIGSSESLSGLVMELIGFDGTAAPVFGLQLTGFSVRNRVHYTGTPTAETSEYLTAAQVRALVASGVVFQFSNATDSGWHYAPQISTDVYARFRSTSSASAAWSSVITLLRGADGASCYTYVGYASDTQGGGFSTTPSASLKYIAFITSATAIATPASSDFASATWVKFIGDDGVYTLPTASADTLGGVKVGANLTMTNGVLAATDTTYGAATSSAAGLMSASDKAKLDTLNTGYLGFYATAAALQTAHPTGSDGQYAMVGATDTIWSWDSDTSAWVNSGSTSINPAWSDITGKPTTLAGYGITDASISGSTITLGSATLDTSNPAPLSSIETPTVTGGTLYTQAGKCYAYSASATTVIALGSDAAAGKTGVCELWVTPSSGVSVTLGTGLSWTATAIITPGETSHLLVEYYGTTGYVTKL